MRLKTINAFLSIHENYLKIFILFMINVVELSVAFLGNEIGVPYGSRTRVAAVKEKNPIHVRTFMNVNKIYLTNT